jgi:hypothetical protein
MMAFLSLAAASSFPGCASPTATASLPKASPAADFESRWGIHIEAVRLTAEGHLIDFRYRVVDPYKAENLMRRGDQAYLIDQASGAQLPVPVTKVGQLRGTGQKPTAGRIYTVMFSSGAGVVRQGSAVTVVIGEFRAENLVVE